MELLVVTQNAWGGAPAWPRRRAALVRLLDRLRPDCVGLQEVHTAPGALPTQAHEVAAALPGYRAEFLPAWRKPRGVEEGVAILFRHRLLGRAELALEQAPGDALDRVARRVVLACTLEVGDRPVEVLTTHLSLSPQARLRNAAELRRFAEARLARAGVGVLLGDFNATPGAPELQALEGWRDAWAAVHGQRGGQTYPTPLPLRRIDYVFARGAEALACERLSPAGSDHRGVAARLRLPG